MEEDLYSKTRNKCHDSAFHSFGFAFVFDKRADYYKKWLTWLTVLGILVPSMVGMTALGYSYNSQILKQAILIAIPITIIQFAFSIISIVFQWSDELSYSYEASQSYNDLYARFKQLGDCPPSSYDELNLQYLILEKEHNLRSQQDKKHNIAEWELRRGMRYSLREHRIECSSCKKIPLSMKSENCYVCGCYSIKHRIL